MKKKIERKKCRKCGEFVPDYCIEISKGIYHVECDNLIKVRNATIEDYREFLHTKLQKCADMMKHYKKFKRFKDYSAWRDRYHQINEALCLLREYQNKLKGAK